MFVVWRSLTIGCETLEKAWHARYMAIQCCSWSLLTSICRGFPKTAWFHMTFQSRRLSRADDLGLFQYAAVWRSCGHAGCYLAKQLVTWLGSLRRQVSPASFVIRHVLSKEFWGARQSAKTVAKHQTRNNNDDDNNDNNLQPTMKQQPTAKSQQQQSTTNSNNSNRQQTVDSQQQFTNNQ